MSDQAELSVGIWVLNEKELFYVFIVAHSNSYSKANSIYVHSNGSLLAFRLSSPVCPNNYGNARDISSSFLIISIV